MANSVDTRTTRSGLKGFVERNRTLETYPVGGHRWAMLMLTVLATVVSFYEFGFSGLLPLWFGALHFTPLQFSYFLAFAVALSAVSASIGGPLADRHGRVIVIDVCLVVMIALTFCNLLMTNFWSFVLIRGAMNLTAGLTWGALGGLTRDMSPRVSRGTAFGLLTFGAVLCLWLWNFIPGITLPYFHTWQSQIWIMGALSVVMGVPVLVWLKDLHPSLRLTVVESADVASAGTSAPAAAMENDVPGGAREAFGQLLSHYEPWALVIGAVAFLTVAITVQSFGPLMFTQQFKYSTAAADRITANFWFLNLLTLVPAGYLSDKLGVRKPLSLIFAAMVAALLLWWIPTFAHPLSMRAQEMVTLLLGALAAAAYIPWTAQFSELLEDISPALQATGWSFFQLVYRIWIAISGLLIVSVAATHGWETWMWVALSAVGLFAASLLSIRGHWLPVRAEETATATTPSASTRPSPA